MQRNSYVAVALADPSPGPNLPLGRLAALWFDRNGTTERFDCLVQLSEPAAGLFDLFEHEASAKEPTAISMDEAAERLVRFANQSPIAGFFGGRPGQLLRRQLTSAGAGPLDLGELAALLLPALPGPDLTSVREALSMEPDTFARSAEIGCRDVLLALEDRGRTLSPETLRQVNRLTSGLEWPARRFFLDLERHSALSRRLDSGSIETSGSPRRDSRLELRGLIAEPLPHEPPARSSFETDVLAVEDALEALTPSSRFASRFPGFEPRPQQVVMARAVAHALNGSEHLLVEAGTGTGKSLAYLLPAIDFALRHDARVVISTHTINLQDQLYQKDIPDLRLAGGTDFTTSVLKGRDNYVCLSRMLELLRRPTEELLGEERLFLVKLLLWLPWTRRGDRSELNIAARDEPIWQRVAASAAWCTPGRCPFHRDGLCFLARARAAAESSHLVIVNHSLLLTDLQAMPRILPPYRQAIVDEAHHLEAAATNQLSRRATRQELLGALDRIAPRASVLGSILHEAQRLLSLRVSTRAAGSTAPSVIFDALQESAAEVRGALEALFQALGDFLRTRDLEADEEGAVARISDRARLQPAWSDLELLWDARGDALPRLVQHLSRLVDLLDLPREAVAELQSLRDELEAQRESWNAWYGFLNELALAPRPNVVYWLSLTASDDLALSAAPLEVGPLLREKLLGGCDSVIFTSATMTTDGRFDHIRSQLGAEEAAELSVGSPFDFQQAALLYLPDDIAEPNQAGYQAALDRILLDLGTRLNGRTLALFTSHAQLRITHAAVRERCRAAGITLLAQGLDGASRHQLLDRFRRDERCVLLGTGSFWEGIDVAGEALSCLLIAKLPFAVPSDPIFQARSELFDDPFERFALPHAILRLKQGVGRLIRTRDDRGAVVICDRRIDSRSYGRAFLRSLPPCTLERGPVAQVGLSVVRFLSARREIASRSDAEPSSERARC